MNKTGKTIARAGLSASFFASRRGRVIELIWWAAALAVFFLFPNYLAFATSVLVIALFALSLNLILGFAGIITLGHAMFFGVGAYTAGLLAVGGWTEPVTGALVGGLAGAMLAAITGPVVLRFSGLPLVMITLAISVLFFEAANKATWLTGGDDGLFGIRLAPLFGQFRWTIFGTTQYLYVLAWLALVFVLLRRLIASPFGIALEGIRENPARMRLIGAPVLRHMVIVYTISGFVAGLAGALSAQTTRFVGLVVFSIETSVDALIIVVLGGLHSLYGALIGAPVYLSVKYFSQQWNPHLWKFFVGGLLVMAMLYAKGGLVVYLERGWARLCTMFKGKAR
jgi:branched-chain amino acid transport system permease protein